MGNTLDEMWDHPEVRPASGGGGSTLDAMWDHSDAQASPEDDYNQFKKTYIAHANHSLLQQGWDEIKAGGEMFKGLAKSAWSGASNTSKGLGEIVGKAVGENPDNPAMALAQFNGDTTQSGIEAATKLLYEAGNGVRKGYNYAVNNPTEALLKAYATPFLGGRTAVHMAMHPGAPTEEEIRKAYDIEMADRAYSDVGESKIAPNLTGEANKNLAQGLQDLPVTIGAVEGGAGLVNGSAVNALRRSAVADRVKAIDATGKANKAAATRVAEEMTGKPLGETFAWTREGLAQKAEEAATKAGEAINDYGAPVGDSPLGGIIDKLKSEREKLLVDGKPTNPAAVANVDAMIDVIAQHGDALSLENLQKMRRQLDKEVGFTNWHSADVVGKQAVELKKITSNEIRSILAQADPDLAQLNKVYNFNENLRKVATDTANRVRPQGAGVNIASAIGAVAGGGNIGEIASKFGLMKFTLQALRSPGYRLLSGRVKDLLADALSSGNMSKAAELARSGENAFKAGDSLSVKIGDKEFHMSYVGKTRNGYKVRMANGKLRVVPLEDVSPIGLAVDQPPIPPEISQAQYEADKVIEAQRQARDREIMASTNRSIDGQRAINDFHNQRQAQTQAQEAQAQSTYSATAQQEAEQQGFVRKQRQYMQDKMMEARALKEQRLTQSAQDAFRGENAQSISKATVAAHQEAYEVAKTSEARMLTAKRFAKDLQDADRGASVDALMENARKAMEDASVERYQSGEMIDARQRMFRKKNTDKLLKETSLALKRAKASRS